MRARIICIGNRFCPEDASGLEVYDCIETLQALPPGIELIEGGLAGLNLLPHLEQGGRVIFVDAVRGFAREGEICILSKEDVLPSPGQCHFGHEAGLPYVLAVLPKVCEGRLPEEIILIGLEGRCEQATIEKAAQMSVAIAEHGLRGLG